MSTKTTRVQIDEELLSQVRHILSTSTVRETIEEAFREVLRQKARQDEIQALSTMEGMDLDKPEIMAQAWRK